MNNSYLSGIMLNSLYKIYHFILTAILTERERKSGMFWEHQPNKELDYTVGRERNKIIKL